MRVSCATNIQFTYGGGKASIFTEQSAAETQASTPPSAIFAPCTPLELNFTFPNVLCSMYREEDLLCKVPKNLVIQNGIHLGLPLNLELILNVLAKPGSWRIFTSHGYEGCHE